MIHVDRYDELNMHLIIIARVFRSIKMVVNNKKKIVYVCLNWFIYIQLKRVDWKYKARLTYLV